MDNPRWNKGTAFTAKEREAFGLTGRLPPHPTVNTIDDQCQRAYDQLSNHESDLRKNAFMQSMRSQNWVLYYALMQRRLKALMPIIYTPTEVSLFAIQKLILICCCRAGGCNRAVLSFVPPFGGALPVVSEPRIYGERLPGADWRPRCRPHRLFGRRGYPRHWGSRCRSE